MFARDVMSPDVACCPPDLGVGEVARLMVDKGCGAIPVVEDRRTKRLVGIVTDRDIVCRLVARGRDPLRATAADCMSAPVASVGPDASLEECSDLMERYQVRRVPVVDDTGCCCGIVAQADVARTAHPERAGELVESVSRPGSAPSAVR
jgi:CBS domain-containing protein